MKAEELIKNNALQDIEVAGKQKVVFEEIAITAVSMARKEEKERKEAELKTNIENSTKPKKIRDIKKHYQKKKQELLENEKQFGYIGRILIEGIDIHDPDFEKLLMEKIK